MDLEYLCADFLFFLKIAFELLSGAVGASPDERRSYYPYYISIYLIYHLSCDDPLTKVLPNT